MKKLLTLIVIILIVGGAWFALHKHSSTTVITEPTPSGNTTTSVQHPNPSNATFTFDDGSVTLKNGTASTPAGDDSISDTETDLTKTISYGDINGDGKEDAVVGLLQQGGGSGEFLYIAGYISGNVSYKGTNAVFIGDRVQPTSLTIKNGTITLSYLDRGPNDPMSSEPTVPVTKTYTYTNDQIVEK